MSHRTDLQQYLKDTGRYFGRVDDIWGPETRAAVLTAVVDGPDTRLTADAVRVAAARWDYPFHHLVAVLRVEAQGQGFEDGRPKILPEPHRFSRLTNRKFDQLYPMISYRNWGERPYPASQAARYDRLMMMVECEAWAGFSACSWGLGQVLGENHKLCGYDTPWEFAFAMGRDEFTQLLAMLSFIERNRLDVALRKGEWAAFARGYNGTAYRQNKYDQKLAAAAAACVERGGTL